MLVRVRDNYTGHRYTTAVVVAESDLERFEVLDAPAVDGNGRPLPPDTPPIADGGAAEVAADTFEATEEAH